MHRSEHAPARGEHMETMCGARGGGVHKGHAPAPRDGLGVRARHAIRIPCRAGIQRATAARDEERIALAALADEVPVPAFPRDEIPAVHAILGLAAG